MSDAPLPPAYIRFDKKQREEFLSQCGIVSPSHREMFHQLCQTWRPFIDFDSFTGARTGVVTHPSHETEGLVARLRAAKLGLFTYRKNDKGERVPKDIILCDENSPRYWYFFVQDLIQQSCDNPRNPYLTVGLLRSREILLPAGAIEDLEPRRLHKTGIEELTKAERLVFLTVGGERLLATSQTLGQILSFSSAKLRFILKNPEITAAVSRLLNLGLSDVAKRLDDKESGFWRTLTETLLRSKDDLLADRRLHLDVSFFQAAELFNLYLTNQLDEAHRQKELAAERDGDLRQLEMLILQDKEVLMPPEELEGHLRILFKEKYGDQFDGFRDEFYLSFTRTNQKVTIAPVVTLKAGLVHRNNLYKYFLKRFESLGPLLRDEYKLKMERRLKHPRGHTDLDFLNRDNLERSLVEWTAKTDPLVDELLKQPRLLAEAIIHHGRTALGLGSVDDARPLLERFFRPGIMTLRTYQELYAIDVPRLYESAFKKLSVFTQFWRRLTGSYRIQAGEFQSLALPREKSSESSRAPREEEDDRSLDELSPEERKARKAEWRRRKAEGGGGTKAKEPAAPAAPKVKTYSEGERNKAWSEFKETLTPKD